MLRSTKMFVEQSNHTMPPSVWLHINGVSLTTDIHPYQPPVHSYDYRTKHLQSPVQPPTPPLVSPSSFVPYSITMIDGPYSNNNNHNNNNNKPYQKFGITDMSKKFFIDRHIKKAKSLPGLLKGTALSRHTSLQSSTFTSPALVHSSTNTMQDDQLPMVTVGNDDDSPSIPQTNENQSESRRPRVYFADFNKIQFIEDNNETSQQQQTPNHYPRRRHRRRLTKKTSNTNGTNQISPSIQQTQILQNFSHPLSRQPHHQPTQELSIKKQQLLISPRAHSSRITHLPDILNQSLPIESSSNESSNEKYTLQREKPLVRVPKPIIEIPSSLPTDISTEDAQNNIPGFSPIPDSHTQTHESEFSESNNGLLVHGSPSVSQTSINRPRPSLRTISLRQQFISPIKLKSTGVSSTTNTNHHHPPQSQSLNNSLLNTRRSASLKQSTLRTHDDNDDLHSNNGPLLATENNRPMTSTRSIKQLKRSDGIHFNSKNPFGGSTINDSTKSHVHERTPERFQNLLTIVRPPYAGVNGTSSTITSLTPNDSTIQPNNHQHTMVNYRLTRGTSARESFGYHPTSNTITV